MSCSTRDQWKYRTHCTRACTRTVRACTVRVVPPYSLLYSTFESTRTVLVDYSYRVDTRNGSVVEAASRSRTAMSCTRTVRVLYVYCTVLYVYCTCTRMITFTQRYSTTLPRHINVCSSTSRPFRSQAGVSRRMRSTKVIQQCTMRFGRVCRRVRLARGPLLTRQSGACVVLTAYILLSTFRGETFSGCKANRVWESPLWAQWSTSKLHLRWGKLRMQYSSNWSNMILNDDE